MLELHAGYFLAGVLIFTVYRLAETIKVLGGGEDLPRKNGSMIFEFILGGVWAICAANLLIYMISLPLGLGLLALVKILPFCIFVFSAILFASNALINPSKNFLLAILTGTIVTFIAGYFILFVFNGIAAPGDFSLILNSMIAVLIGVCAGLLCYILLSKINSNGNQPLWAAEKLWKIFTNRKFLIIYIIFIGIETYFQIQGESLLTIF
ncbi:MAG: hypothetical protein ACTSQQ_08735 [Candidatus Helarchaeota archaeon]